MSISVIDNDRELLNAKYTPGRSRMASNSPAIRTRKDATKPNAQALKPILEFTHASEDPRETTNDR